MEDADGTDGGRTGGLRRAGDEWTGGRAYSRIRADGAWTSVQADESGLAVGQTGEQAGGLKDPAPRSPLHSQAPRLLASLQSEFARRLGVHWGPSRGYIIFFLLRTTYLQFKHNTIVKCLPELFWHCLEL